ncbi:MAG: hypothetical protein WCT26_02275 [Candidatus Buchananbacteria bacterium]
MSEKVKPLFRYLQPWLILILLGGLVVWIELGMYIFSGCANPISKIVMSFTDLGSIIDYLYVWTFCFAANVVIFLWLLIKFGNSFINKNSMRSIKNDLLLDITRYTDDEIIQANSELGIRINGTEAVIPIEILNSASKESLAQNIGCLLYMHSSEIWSLLEQKKYTSMHAMADLMLLNNWNADDIEKLIELLGQYKIFLAEALDAAVSRRSLELRVSQLQKEIEASRKREADLIQISPPGDIENKFKNYKDLAAGKSATWKWLKRKAKRWIPKFLRGNTNT